MTFHLHLARNVAVAALFATGVLTLLLWLVQALRFLEVIVEENATALVFAQLAVLTLPDLIGNLLPIGTFAAILFVYNRLTNDRELIVMQAAGTSPLRLAAPAIALALASAVVTLFMGGWLAPEANRQMGEVRFALRSGLAVALLREGTFNDVDDGLVVYFRNRDERGALLDVIIHDSRDPAQPVTTMAQRGELIATEEGRTRVVVHHGQRQELERATGRLNRITFERYALDLEEDQQDMPGQLREPREWTTWELLSSSEDLQPGLRSKGKVELHQRLSAAIFALSLPMLALASLLGRPFDRRGQAVRVTATVLVAFAFQLASLGMSNMTARYDAAVVALYLLAVLPLIAGIWSLTRGTLPPARRPAPV
ncbi:MAG TPA: LPS export ABC transporter permease LptF [Arenibaculum sp.]|nr:LPS export ABC transporter permease LptF [Arenibaculum sp.]